MISMGLFYGKFVVNQMIIFTIIKQKHSSVDLREKLKIDLYTSVPTPLRLFKAYFKGVT